MTDLKLTISRNIMLLRQRNGWTQGELAEKLNYSDKAVSKWERGESIPDIITLKQIADLFHVSLDYLVEEKHPVERQKKEKKVRSSNFYRAIIGLSILLVWFIAVGVFLILNIVGLPPTRIWLSFAYAVPATSIVALVLNSVWLKPSHNYPIISVLMWSVLASLFLSFAAFGYFYWLIFLLGIPGQAIIITWYFMRKRSKQVS